MRAGIGDNKPWKGLEVIIPKDGTTENIASLPSREKKDRLVPWSVSRLNHPEMWGQFYQMSFGKCWAELASS